MRTLFALVFSLFLASCTAGGYMPPVSTGVAPHSAPTAPIAGQWRAHPPHTYDSGQGRMIAVHTNPAIGGTMFFEVVPSGGDDPTTFAAAACRRLAKGRSGIRCGAIETFTRFAYVEIEREGDHRTRAMFVYRKLGDRSRILACSAAWMEYDSASESRFTQNHYNTLLLGQTCKTLAGY